MNLHEYQGKQLFAEYGLPVSRGHAVASAEEAVKAAESLGGSKWVVKTQVHAGGRGKAGGVTVASSTTEVSDFAGKWLGKKLVTYITPKLVSLDKEVEKALGKKKKMQLMKLLKEFQDAMWNY